MAKNTVLWLVSIVLTTVFISPAFATVEADFIDNFTTADSFNTGSTPEDPFANPVPKNTFDLTEIPYIYLETSANNFPDPHTYGSSVTTNWYFGGVEKFSTGGPGYLNQNEFFFTPNNWDTIKQVGLWTIDSSYELRPLLSPGELTAFGGSSTQFNVTTATVTPEPASMALFGLGAGALGLSRKLRKKKKS